MKKNILLMLSLMIAPAVQACTFTVLNDTKDMLYFIDEHGFGKKDMPHLMFAKELNKTCTAKAMPGKIGKPCGKWFLVYQQIAATDQYRMSAKLAIRMCATDERENELAFRDGQFFYTHPQLVGKELNQDRYVIKYYTGIDHDKRITKAQMLANEKRISLQNRYQLTNPQSAPLPTYLVAPGGYVGTLP